ncbi:Diacylglycerol kinase catalytic domain-containing protein [Fictibacillus macauensis ZFHKF-1]|uniref:Diacylglycerol kinase catalytic domain-containing protein n=1 Tax=Fictibacillus macauensis ZFHKF-1 TaxID=1196324 RepID=I8UG14_9BACL|nr:diacylglycerol kinase family protein [Fictibacillus macauensis]EIT85840.1 Diacylglycerol kinase catalytic domain-containing protein [Fictibacillus macauensis ZFHKF-1]
MKKAAIILNPKAGNETLVQNITIIAKKLEEIYPHVHIEQTKKPGDGKAFLTTHGQSYDLIVGAGGDGTIHELINGLAPLAQRPTFAILPGGTCNDFSRALGINQDPLKAVEQILAHKTASVDVGCWNDDYYFLNFWGIGLITDVSENIDGDMKEKFGRLSYYVSAAQTITNYTPFSIELRSKEQSYKGEATMVIVGNGPFTGGIKPFFPHTDIQDGKFDVLIVKQPSMKLLWETIQSKFRNEMPEHDDIEYFQTDSLEITTTPQQLIDCDGERGETTPASLKNLKQHIEVIVGDFPLQ